MNGRSILAPLRRVDARWYQIAMLSGLLLYGMLGLDFDLSPLRVAGVLGTALLAQWACTKLWKLPAYDPLSALISGIGLCTLLRTDLAVVACATAAVAILSKFLIRWDGRHLFNPTNIAILLAITLSGHAWVSPGQYGSFAFAAFFIFGMGVLVVTQASRADVTFAYLGAWLAILFGRSLWLGEPMTIPLHRMESGMLLQFSFNMISDPRTTPRSSAGRILFGVLVALGAGVVQFVLFRTNGPIWSLAAFSLFVPLINRLLPGPRHEWNAPTSRNEKGASHEPSASAVPAGARALVLARP